jgi:hypothetical protein
VISWTDVEGRWEPVGTEIRSLDGTPLTAVRLRLPWGQIWDAALGSVRCDPASPTSSPRAANACNRGDGYTASFKRSAADHASTAPEHSAEVARVYQRRSV